MRELMQMGKGREWDSETYRESLAATRYKQRLLQFRQAQQGHEAYTQVMRHLCYNTLRVPCSSVRAPHDCRHMQV